MGILCFSDLKLAYTFEEQCESGFADMNFKCNMDQLVGLLVPLLVMLKLCQRSVLLLVLVMVASRYDLSIFLCGNCFDVWKIQPRKPLLIVF